MKWQEIYMNQRPENPQPMNVQYKSTTNLHMNTVTATVSDIYMTTDNIVTHLKVFTLIKKRVLFTIGPLERDNSTNDYRKNDSHHY